MEHQIKEAIAKMDYSNVNSEIKDICVVSALKIFNICPMMGFNLIKNSRDLKVDYFNQKMLEEKPKVKGVYDKYQGIFINPKRLKKDKDKIITLTHELSHLGSQNGKNIGLFHFCGGISTAEGIVDEITMRALGYSFEEYFKIDHPYREANINTNLLSCFLDNGIEELMNINAKGGYQKLIDSLSNKLEKPQSIMLMMDHNCNEEITVYLSILKKYRRMQLTKIKNRLPLIPSLITKFDGENIEEKISYFEKYLLKSLSYYKKAIQDEYLSLWLEKKSCLQANSLENRLGK